MRTTPTSLPSSRPIQVVQRKAKDNPSNSDHAPLQVCLSDSFPGPVQPEAYHSYDLPIALRKGTRHPILSFSN